jgi:hypothetical protein
MNETAGPGKNIDTMASKGTKDVSYIDNNGFPWKRRRVAELRSFRQKKNGHERLPQSWRLFEQPR